MMEKFGFGASRRKNITLIALKHGRDVGCFSWFGLGPLRTLRKKMVQQDNAPLIQAQEQEIL
ncbi:hypothetical protein RhiirA4_464496 [Rhizophagus irregularis]|uniref:Uncharacterized protein n=1 Tax=Rhizophagus irregularis TaxID=588596 RepID=A0A2I1GQ85_9GLOM|nr:hypothetical protein RhiirA4_464496 [Rhizophagus irregularis]